MFRTHVKTIEFPRRWRICNALPFVTLDVKADGGPAAAGARQSVDDARAVAHDHADPLHAQGGDSGSVISEESENTMCS